MDFGIGISGRLGSPRCDLVTILTRHNRGPLVFSLLLSFLLSITASHDQKEVVFTGVFTLVWIGTLVVTWQIRLLGGKM